MTDETGGIVELIIAVDLDPSDPEEPLNVSSVDVRDKGEGGAGDEDWRGLTMQLLMGDPASGVTSDGIGYDEAVEAVSRALGGMSEPEDPFTKAGKPKDKPKPPHRGGGGGMKEALDRALGRKDEDEDDDEDEE